MRSRRGLLAVLLAWGLALNAEEPYRLALPNYRFEFPRDYFNHPDFQTEWWYYTGNVRTSAGRRFGFELTFFRHALTKTPVADNVWDVRDLWLAHLALSDMEGGQFLHTERLNRSGPGIAGADLKQARVWNGNWQAQWTLNAAVPGGATQMLQAVADRFSFELALKPEKPPVIHGENGVSQKAQGPGKASHYISFTRLSTSGTIILDGKRFSVEGTAWMDHEFFSHQLEASQSGWDWFSLQLDDGSEIMLFRLRRADGSRDRYSAGTYVDTQGHSRHLAADDFTVTPGKTWTSAVSGGRYPVEWTVEAPSIGFKAEVHTPLSQQEIAGGYASVYWEGAIDVEGTRLGRPLRGVGYLEMTGYAGSIAGLN